MNAPERFARADTSGIPLVPRTPLWLLALAAVLAATPVIGWLWFQGRSSATITAVVVVSVVLAVSAEEPIQRLIGGGRLDNRPALRTLIALGLFGSILHVIEMGFLLPLAGVLIAAVHVHWSGARAWPQLALLTVGVSVAGQVLVGFGLVGSLVPPLASHAITVAAAWVAVLSIANLGLAVARREEIAEALSTAEARFRALVLHSADVAAIVDRSGRFTYVSPAAFSALGLRPEDLLGTEVTTIIDPRDHDATTRKIVGLVEAEPLVTKSWEVRRRSTGGSRWLELCGRNLCQDPVIDGVLLHLRDVTERRGLHEQLIRAASQDWLTDLANRASFFTALEHHLSGAHPGRGVGALYCDLDGFKEINDSLGHHAGDEVLVATARRLRRALRPVDLLARIGGDEFTALLPDVPDEATVTATAQRLKAAMRDPIRLSDGHLVVVRISVGHAWAEDSSTTARTLLHDADQRMYQDKRSSPTRAIPAQPIAARPSD